MSVLTGPVLKVRPVNNPSQPGVWLQVGGRYSTNPDNCGSVGATTHWYKITKSDLDTSVGKEMLSVALTAMASTRDVTIMSNGKCPEGIEGVWFIELQ